MIEPGKWFLYDEKLEEEFQKSVGYKQRLRYPACVKEILNENGTRKIAFDTEILTGEQEEWLRPATEEEIIEEKWRRDFQSGDWIIKRKYSGSIGMIAGIVDEQGTISLNAKFSKGTTTKERLKVPHQIRNIQRKETLFIQLENGELHQIFNATGIQKATKEEIKKHKLQQLFEIKP